MGVWNPLVHDFDGSGATLKRHPPVWHILRTAHPGLTHQGYTLDTMPEETDRRPLERPFWEPPADSTDLAAAPRRSGPLSVERHRKADGRLLILYARRADPESEGS